MAGYLPAAAAERAAQYAALGLSGPEALYRDVPESVRLTAAPSCGGPGLTTTTSPRR